MQNTTGYRVMVLNTCIGEEVAVALNGRIGQMVAVLLFAGLLVIVEQGIGNAVEFYTVRGVVEYASEDALTVENEMYDIRGVPVIDENEEAILERGSFLCGKMAVILYRDGKLISAKIFSSVPE